MYHQQSLANTRLHCDHYRLLGGPILGALFGLGAAYASEKEGPAGETARTMGDIAISVGEEAKEIDQQLHMSDSTKKVTSSAVDTTRKVTSTAVERARGFEDEHHTVQHTKDFFVVTWQAIMNFVHSDAVERAAEGIGRACYWAADMVTSDQSAYGPFTTAEPTNESITEPTTESARQESGHQHID